MSDEQTTNVPDWKEQRPQNKNLIPLNERPPEEALEIRRKGQAASNKKRRENASMREVVRQVLAMGYRKGPVADPDKIMTLEEAEAKNVPVHTRIVLQEVRKYFSTGDIEARNWLMKYGYPDGELDGLSTHSGAAEIDPNTPDDAVRIHLIRGEKPPEPSDSSEEATRGRVEGGSADE